LLIYTGGTIGMVEHHKTGELQPFDFNYLHEHIPEIERFNISFRHISFDPPIDSSNMQPETWKQLAKIIMQEYEKADGFVVLHGTDTMAYTASALSFMIRGLNKPIIFTGSQLPMGMLRTDGKENLITAIEIASAVRSGRPVVSEVAIYFEYKLYRGNRTVKYSSEHFDAFRSPNYPLLAEAGIHISYNDHSLLPWRAGKPQLHSGLENRVLILPVFPGISGEMLSIMMRQTDIRGLVLETFGAGNSSTDSGFTGFIKEMMERGMAVVNITQCLKGRVVPGLYQTSSHFVELGVIAGGDLTREAALTKLMVLLAEESDPVMIRRHFEEPIAGEMSDSAI
jgi:L-asparaginase